MDITETISPHPITILKKRIREARNQYRHNSDTSPSLFHPESGFIYAYPCIEVDAAIEEFESNAITPYKANPLCEISEKERLIQNADLLSRTHDSLTIRDFARDVMELIQEIHHSPLDEPIKVAVFEKVT